MNRMIQILMLIAFCLLVSIQAQSQSIDRKVIVEEEEDKTTTTQEWSLISFPSKAISPTIQVFYSASSPSLLNEKHKDYNDPFSGDFFKSNFGEIRLGTTMHSMKYPDFGIADYDFSSIYFKYLGPEGFTMNSPLDNEYNLKVLQFGFSGASGYGYRSEDGWFGFYLFTGGTMNWSDVAYSIESGGDIESNTALNTFDGTLRFGESYESGFKIGALGPLNLITSYESMIIYPRHLFWKWTISELIEQIGIGVAGQFAKSIMKKSPELGPIVNWVLKTGIYYGLYELRKTNMNWPYKTAPPLMINSWKLGLSMEF